MERTCAYCRLKTVEIQEGHRKRQYCSAGCRQAAYRERKSQENRTELEQQAIVELRKRWPEFSWNTWCFLQRICRPLGEGFMEQVAKVISDERMRALLNATQSFHPSLQDDRNGAV